MRNTFGNAVSVTLFGESHGAAIGAVIDGLTPGIELDEEFIARQMKKRLGVPALSTARREADRVRIVSGTFRGKTCGTPLTLMIENADTRSKNYDALFDLPRPGHADLTGRIKYGCFNDYTGGGHFSGRITAALTAAGAVALTALRSLGIRIGTHLLSCGGESDRRMDPVDPSKDLDVLEAAEFPALDKSAADRMTKAILEAKNDLDSVGGVLETTITGLPAGVGEPWFDSVESVLSHLLFSIPAVKGVEFGEGFGLAGMRGSAANDPFAVKDGKVVTVTNNCGGILGGITDGMPVILRTAVKPTPSIYKEQDTVDLRSMEPAKLKIEGRHDPAVVYRAAVVQDSVCAIGICDLLAQRYGTDLAGTVKG